MRKIKADRYQKQRSPKPETIDFSGPVIGDKPTEEGADDLVEEGSDVRTTERTFKRSNEQTGEQSNERSNDEVRRHNVYLIAVPSSRVRVRHSFDVFEDQKVALDQLQMATRDATGDKPNLGEMVQKALDDFIQKQIEELPNVQPLNRTFERTDKRTNERSDGEKPDE